MPLRLALSCGALALVAGWWLALAGPPPSGAGGAGDAAAVRPAAMALAGGGESPFSARLRRERAQLPPAPAVRRNPFLFAGGAAPATAAAVSMPAASSVPPPLPPSGPPPMTLAGVAVTETDAGTVRTAVVSVDGQVLLVRPGDALPDGRRVVRVEDDHLVLADAAGTETILRLPL